MTILQHKSYLVKVSMKREGVYVYVIYGWPQRRRKGLPKYRILTFVYLVCFIYSIQKLFHVPHFFVAQFF